MIPSDRDTPAQPAGWPAPRSLLACGTLVLALVLSACGGGKTSDKKSGSGSSPAATSASTSAATSAAPSAAPPGSAGSGSSFHPGGDFCSLVTAAEAAAVVGTQLLPGVSRTASGPAGQGGSCLYNATQRVVGKPTVVHVIVLGTKIPRTVYDQQLKGNPNAGPITPVSGLGDDAFAIPGVVTVFDHGLVLSLEIIKNGVPADTATITDLLRKALSRAGNVR